MADVASNYPLTVFDDGNRGDGGKSQLLASLIVQGQGSDASRAIMLQQAQDAKDAARDVAQVRQELAALAKDNAVNAERLERENQNRIREVEEKVRLEGEATRNLIERHRCEDLAAENAELKAKILALTPVPPAAP